MNQKIIIFTPGAREVIILLIINTIPFSRCTISKAKTALITLQVLVLTVFLVPWSVLPSFCLFEAGSGSCFWNASSSFLGDSGFISDPGCAASWLMNVRLPWLPVVILELVAIWHAKGATYKYEKQFGTWNQNSEFGLGVCTDFSVDSWQLVSFVSGAVVMPIYDLQVARY